MTGLQTTIGVNPELIRAEVLEHLLDSFLDFLFTRDAGRVNVVDTRSNVSWVGFVNEDLEELSVALAVLNTENIGVQRGDGMEEILEFGVAEVGVDLRRVLDTGDRKTEGLDCPVYVILTFQALS